jgi:hypothetical protein
VLFTVLENVSKKGEAIPVIGYGGLYGCEMSMIPHFLDSCVTDGGGDVSLTHQLDSMPQKIAGTHLC